MDFGNQIKNDLMDILSFEGRFSHYQELAPCVQKRLKGLETLSSYQSNQLPLDSARYEWIESNLNIQNAKVVDLGANLGYFSIRLASERNCYVHAYEALPEYAKSIEMSSQICEVQDFLKVSTKSITLEDIKQLEPTDLFLHLNVLHHAGIFYDKNKIFNSNDWYQYALNHLKFLSNVSDRLLIQIGNMWGNQILFDSDRSIDYICELLSLSNWDVKKIGLINDFDNFTYETYLPEDFDDIPRISIWRNSQTKLVEYKHDNEIIAELKSGSAHRPIFLCEKMKIVR
jgi:hypothetical protein